MEPIISQLINAIFRKEIDMFMFQTGDVLARLFKKKSNASRTLKQKVECAKRLGCLFWIIFPVALFLFFYFYAKLF
jgi:hypothetical protein